MLKEYIRGVKSGIPICLGYVSVSFTYGLMATRGGMSILSALILSMTNLTSAGQFAGTDIIIAGGNLVELIVTTLVINIRYMLMSLSLSQRIDPKAGTIERLIMSFGITDEIYAMSSQEKQNISFVYFLGLMTMPYLGWSFGTFIGAFSAGLLPEVLRMSLGIAIYGMFIAIIIPPAKASRPIQIVTLISVVLSIIFRYTPILKSVSSGWVIIICTLISCTVGAILFPEKERDEVI